MKRLILVGAALAVVVTATASANPSSRSVKSIAAGRRQAAGRAAEKLLRSFVAPPRARVLRHRPSGAGSLLSRGQLGIFLFAELAKRHAFWQVRAPIDSVVAFEKAHVPGGFVLASSGRTSGRPRNVELEFDGPVADAHPPRGLLGVAIVQLRGSVVLRVDAGAAWIYPRSPLERVPADVREVDLTASHVSRHVKDPAKVSEIVRWFDALNIVQPGTERISCPLVLRRSVKLAFRSATGAILARAVDPAGSASVCDPIEFNIRGHQQTSLIDGFRRPSFAYRLQRLLGVRLIARRR
jgi:hypothetical protein